MRLLYYFIMGLQSAGRQSIYSVEFATCFHMSPFDQVVFVAFRDTNIQRAKWLQKTTLSRF